MKPKKAKKKAAPKKVLKPIATWESQESIWPGLVWWSRLDGRYQVEVQDDPKNTHAGTLVIFDHNDGDKVLHNEPVGVSYGAMFGPDVADVNAWAERACQIVDGLAGK